jgi:hypothetical protein
MQKKIVVIIFGLVFTILFISGCIYKPDNQKMLKHFDVSNDYNFVSIDWESVSGNECFWFIDITLQNKSTGEIIVLNDNYRDFNYDDCEDRLYYGWYKGMNLPEQYGRII